MTAGQRHGYVGDCRTGTGQGYTLKTAALPKSSRTIVQDYTHSSVFSHLHFPSRRCDVTLLCTAYGTK